MHHILKNTVRHSRYFTIVHAGSCSSDVTSAVFTSKNPPTYGTTYTSSDTTGDFILGAPDDFIQVPGGNCGKNVLTCTGVREAAIVWTTLNGQNTVNYDQSVAGTTGLGFAISGNNIVITLDNILFCPYADLQFRIICYNAQNTDATDKEYSVASEMLTAQLTGIALSQSTTPQWSVSDFSSLTQTTQIDAATPLSIYTSFTQYATCTIKAYPVLASSDTFDSTNFEGDQTTGAVSFTRSSAWVQTYKMKICYDAGETTCVVSSSTFTITVTDCNAAMWSTTTISYPSELIQAYTSVNYEQIEYYIDGNRPTYISFGSFSSNTNCAVTSVLIYADTSKGAQTSLELAFALSSYTPQLINTGNNKVEATYTFSLLLIIGGGVAEQWVELNCATGTCNSLNLRVYINCGPYLTFSKYTSLSSSTLTQGTAGQTSQLESAGSNYLTTNSTALCPITSYTATMLTGLLSDITLGPSTGQLDVSIATVQTLQFTITACALSSTDSSDCKTTSTIEVVISPAGCASALSESGTWTAPFGTINVDITGSTQVVQSLGDYVQTSLTPACDITSYSMTEVSTSGTGGTITITGTTGQITATKDTEYSKTFTVTACANGLTDAANCFTTTTQYVVTVALNGGCSPFITFGTWSPAQSNPVPYNSAGSTISIQSAGSNYFSTSNPAVCPITSYSLAPDTATSITGTTENTSTGSITAAVNLLYTDLFTITACGRSSTAAADCTISPVQQIEVSLDCNNFLSFTTWSPAVLNPISQSQITGTQETLQTAGSSYSSSSDANCPITSYSITDTSGNVQIDPTSGAITALSDQSYTSDFTITICARGSSVSTAPQDCLTSSSNNVIVTNQCLVVPRTTMPTSAETTISSDFVMNGTELMVNKSAYVNGLTSYEVDCSLLFSYNCLLTTFEIVSIYNTLTGSDLLTQDYNKYVSFDGTTGLLKLIKFNEALDLFIKIRASNGMQWTDSTINPQIRLVIQEPVTIDLNFDVIIVPEENTQEEQTTQSVTELQSQDILQPPKFKTSPSCSDLIVDLQNPQKEPYVCQIPEFIPSTNGKTAQLLFISQFPGMSWNPSTREILINHAQIKQADIGAHSIQARITDDLDEQALYMIQLNIKLSDQEQVQAQIQDEQTKNLTSKIDSLTGLGLLTVKFSQNINNVSFNDINSSIWDIYMVPAQDRHLLDPSFNLTKLNFTWKTIAWTNNMLDFQLNFSDPLHISPLIEQDQLVMHLIHPENSSLFFAPQLQKDLHESSWTMRTYVRKQMPNDNAAQQLSDSTEDLKGLMMLFLVISILLYVMSNGGVAMRYMFIMVRSLQLILHLPMLQIVFPANVMTLISIIIPVVGFDVLESFMDWEWLDGAFPMFNFQEHELVGEKLFAQLTDIGYETFNSLMILNTIGVIFIFLVIKMLIWGILLIINLLFRNQKLKQFTDKLAKGLFFGEIIELYIQGLIEFLIAAILSTKMPTYSMLGEMISFSISYTSFFVILVFLPSVSIYIILQPLERLSDEIFQKRWGQIYQNMYDKRKDLSPRFFYLIFVLRRVLYIFMSFMLQKEAVIYQILIVELINIFMLIYTGYFKPVYGTFENRLEIFNEFQVCICTLMIVQFTDWVDSPEVQYEIGWYLCGLILLQVLINQIIIIYYSVRRIIMVLRKIYELTMRFLGRYFECARKRVNKDAQKPQEKSEEKLSSEQQQLEKTREEFKRRKEDMEKFKREQKEREEQKQKILEEVERNQMIDDFLHNEIMVRSKVTSDFGRKDHAQQNKIHEHRGEKKTADANQATEADTTNQADDEFGLGFNIQMSTGNKNSKMKPVRRRIQGVYYLPKNKSFGGSNAKNTLGAQEKSKEGSKTKLEQKKQNIAKETGSRAIKSDFGLGKGQNDLSVIPEESVYQQNDQSVLE